MLLKRIISILAFTFMVLVSCKDRKPADTLFTLEDHTGISFTNTVKNTKDFNIFSYRNFYNGAGVGIGDINNDGLLDIYVCHVSNYKGLSGKNKLYIN